MIFYNFLGFGFVNVIYIVIICGWGFKVWLVGGLILVIMKIWLLF